MSSSDSPGVSEIVLFNDSYVDGDGVTRPCVKAFMLGVTEDEAAEVAPFVADLLRGADGCRVGAVSYPMTVRWLH